MLKQEKGKLMENAVFLHLQREKAKLSKPYQINYWKDYSGNEVDFVIRNGRTINTLISLTYIYVSLFSESIW